MSNLEFDLLKEYNDAVADCRNKQRIYQEAMSQSTRIEELQKQYQNLQKQAADKVNRYREVKANMAKYEQQAYAAWKEARTKLQTVRNPDSEEAVSQKLLQWQSEFQTKCVPLQSLNVQKTMADLAQLKQEWETLKRS